MIYCLLGTLIILIVLHDGFETIVLPRTVDRSLRLAKIYYRAFWRTYRWILVSLSLHKKRHPFSGFFGPFSLITLFGLWAVLLIFGFAFVGFGIKCLAVESGDPGFEIYLYHSGVTFLTLGFGDYVPHNSSGRLLSVIEAGVGFGFLAIMVSYLPVVYQAFSRRESGALLLDARAGSPPTAGEILRRYGEANCLEELVSLLEYYEKWSAELLESLISLPVLAFYRAQHEKLHWLAVLTSILDLCSMIRAGVKEDDQWCYRLRFQADLTFALARHVMVDTAYILGAMPAKVMDDRLPVERWNSFCDSLRVIGSPITEGHTSLELLTKFRSEYEPFAFGLSRYLLLEVPPWFAEGEHKDSWQLSAWDSKVHFVGDDGSSAR